MGEMGSRGCETSRGSMQVLQGDEFEVEPHDGHTFEVEPHRNVGHVVGLQEDVIVDALCKLLKVEKIYAHESLTFNDTVACEVISMWKAGLKDDMVAQSDVYVLSNGCKKCSSDDVMALFWESTPFMTLLRGALLLSLEGSSIRGPVCGKEWKLRSYDAVHDGFVNILIKRRYMHLLGLEEEKYGLRDTLCRLEDMFAACGTIQCVSMPKRSRYGFVYFTSREYVISAMRLHGEKLGDDDIIVRYGLVLMRTDVLFKDTAYAKKQNFVFVKNLAKGVTEDLSAFRDNVGSLLLVLVVNDFEEEKLNEDDGDSNNSNLKENVDESASFGRFKKSVAPSSGGSFMCLMEEVVKVGQTMGYNMDGVINNLSDIIESQGEETASVESMNFLSLNIQGLAQKAKKDWAKELCVKNKVNFLAIQETKMEEIDLFSVRRCWGNSTFEHLHSNSKELNQLDAVIDKGTGTEVEAEKRMEVLAALRNIDHIHSMDLAQKQDQMSHRGR
ncbi:zinc finger, CCHC-type containing protein [Tanacetum coccineum]